MIAAGRTDATFRYATVRPVLISAPACPGSHTGPMGDHQGFSVVLRGYDIAEVEAMLERIRKAAASTDSALRAAMRQDLTDAVLRVRLRGYDRVEVDDYLRRAIDRLA